MVWRVDFTPAADKALGKLERQVQRRIARFIDTRLVTDEDPRRLGEAYKGPLAKYWKYRVADHRLICDIRDREIRILVVTIGDRKEIYR